MRSEFNSRIPLQEAKFCFDPSADGEIPLTGQFSYPAYIMQYTFWIAPPEPLLSQLQEIVDRLAREHTGHLFTPHLTILGDVETDLSAMDDKIKALIHGLPPLDLTLGPVSFSTTYFQNVFVRVNSTAPLMELNLKLKQLLGVRNSVFMPHISLLYGDHDMATRAQVAAALAIEPAAWKQTEIQVIQSTAKPNAWTPVATYPLAGL